MILKLTRNITILQVVVKYQPIYSWKVLNGNQEVHNNDEDGGGGSWNDGIEGREGSEVPSMTVENMEEDRKM